MAHGTCPGPVGTDHNNSLYSSGLSHVAGLPLPLHHDDDRQLFNSAIQALEAQLVNVGMHAHIDSQVRLTYATRIKAMSSELRAAATRGDITWRQAATEANLVRNSVMESLRGKSTPLGRSIAEYLKKEGKTLNGLIAEKSEGLFGKGTQFDSLPDAKKNQVYAKIVESAGKSRPSVNKAMRVTSRAGRGLVFLSVAISVYTVATAEDKVDAAMHEGAVAGAGVAGGIAGGALAGLACGPGAPVCVGVGAFVGGALAAFGVDLFW